MPVDRKLRDTEFATPEVPVTADEFPETSPLQLPETLAPETPTPFKLVTLTLACTILLPFLFTAEVSVTELTLSIRLGFVLMTNVTAAVEVAPRVSVTASVVVKVPAAANVLVTVTPVALVPSPKLQLYERMESLTSGSKEADASKFTDNGAVPVVPGEVPKAA